MHLAFRRACANGTPNDDVGNVLRGDRIQKLCARWHTHACEFDQETPRQPETVVDVVTFIEFGIIDQTLPSDCGARFFKIDTHEDLEIIAIFLTRFDDSFPVLERRSFVMNRAWTHDDQKSVILSREDALRTPARGLDEGRFIFSQWPFVHEHGRFDERQDFGDAEIVGAVELAHRGGSKRDSVKMGIQDGGELPGVNDQWVA